MSGRGQLGDKNVMKVLRSCQQWKARPDFMLEVKRGEPVCLRAFYRSDASALFSYVKDPAVHRFLVVTLPRTVDDVATTLAGMASSHVRVFAVSLASGGPAIGLARLILEARETGNIQYWLGSQFWGRGYGAQVVNALGHIAFDELHLRRLVAQVFYGNTRSVRLLQRRGFTIRWGTELNTEDDPFRRSELHCEVLRENFVYL